MTPLKANTFISFILLFVLLLLSGGAASQRRRTKVAPPNVQRTDTLQVGDSLQMGVSLQGGKGLPAEENHSMRARRPLSMGRLVHAPISVSSTTLTAWPDAFLSSAMVEASASGESPCGTCVGRP